jgi:hypothetical protein
MTEEPPSVPPATDPAAPEPVPAATAPPETPAFEPPPPPPPSRPRQRTLVPWVYALAFIVLGWAVMFLWWNPIGRQSQSGETQRVAVLTHQVQDLAGQVKELGARPAGQPQALASVQAQVAALASAKPAAPDLSGLEHRITALEQRPAATEAKPAPPVDLAPIQQKLASLDQQVTALAGRVDGLGAVRDQMGQVGQRLDQLAHDQQTLTGQVQTLGAGQKDAEAGLTRRIEGEAAAIAALQADIHRIDGLLGQTVKAARAEAALGALQAGRKLGDVPDAPAAVTRFAEEAPPTVADLRRAFPDMAAKVLAASQPADQDKRFVDRVWTRAQSLVTVRQGDHVIVGDPAAGLVARAREDIEAGDLTGAVDALSKLTGPAAQAAASWMQSAQAVLAARAALREMAGQG